MRTYTLHEYFYYTRLERNAGIVLCALCCFTWLLPFAFPLLIQPAPRIDFSEAVAIATMLAPATERAESGAPSFAFRGNENASPRKVETFAFDPNTATKEDFERLGLSSRTAQSILNYRAKGGHFYKKEDLAKIYTLRQEDYERLA
ncbi:MAG: helix-hairpin-helix domain-containing protein, partial [Saprospiraceae bacterium]|nr:helix-hairpin-helix domain-containing protein [Saprospiraceae bacterium]